MSEGRTASELRKQVIREITVAPGWNKEDATALVDELILSLPYIGDKNALREAQAAALDVDALAIREYVDAVRGWNAARGDHERYMANLRWDAARDALDRAILAGEMGRE